MTVPILLLDKCMDFTLAREGGKSNNPNDKGGATNMGITFQTLRKLSSQIHDWDFDKDKDGDVDLQDLWLLDETDVRRVGQEYWIPGLERVISEFVVIKTFDFGFNCGPVSGVKILQRAVNLAASPKGPATVAVDGKLGPLTCNAINLMSPGVIRPALIAAAIEHYRAIVAHDPTQQTFLKGWINRANRVPEGV